LFWAEFWGKPSSGWRRWPVRLEDIIRVVFVVWNTVGARCWGSNNLLDPKQGRRKTRRCETVAREDDGNEDLESARGGL
jgi:hypothetical protein